MRTYFEVCGDPDDTAISGDEGDSLRNNAKSPAGREERLHMAIRHTLRDPRHPNIRFLRFLHTCMYVYIYIYIFCKIIITGLAVKNFTCWWYSEFRIVMIQFAV